SPRYSWPRGRIKKTYPGPDKPGCVVDVEIRLVAFCGVPFAKIVAGCLKAVRYGTAANRGLGASGANAYINEVSWPRLLVSTSCLRGGRVALEIVRDPSPSPSASGKRAASVLSDDGSSGSDSTIRAPRLRTRTTLKWSVQSASEKGPIGLIDIINPIPLWNSTNFRPIHLIKWIRRHHRTLPVQDKDYRNLTRLLINGKIPFHTHPLDEERKIKAVIKVSLEIQTDEVKMTSSIKVIPSAPCTDCTEEMEGHSA
ncbi:hypothetical protein EVAR_96760_1, partial [Eumeta japonica]